MKILISAAETSSDAHGAELLKALKEVFKENLPTEEKLEAFGIGGPKLRSAGLDIVVDARELLAMGFLEIFSHLPKIIRAFRRVVRFAEEVKPDLAIVIDYPDFHFRLARRLKNLGIPVVYYIPPKVWVWRKGRVEGLRTLFERVLCILPFEVEFLKGQGVPAVYVGNPLVDELPLSLSRTQARERLHLNVRDKVIVLMPGSRAAELKMHLEIFLESALMAAHHLRASGFLAVEERLKVLIPFPLMAPLEDVKEELNRVTRFGFQNTGQQSADQLLDIRVSQGNASESMLAADAGLIKSGTSTLEAGILKCPHAVVYKTNVVSAWIFKYLIRYRGPVGLVNLVAGWKPGEDYLVREYLLDQVNSEDLAKELVLLMVDSKKREKQLQGFDLLLSNLGAGAGANSSIQSPSLKAAQEVLQVMRRQGQQNAHPSLQGLSEPRDKV